MRATPGAIGTTVGFVATFSGTIQKQVLPGGTFAWLQEGPADAPLALCVHGFPDHPRTFEPILGPLLDAGYRVAAPFLRGYAPSPVAGPYDAARLGGDVADLAGALSGGAPALLVGHDWGAIAGWHAVAQAPGRFAAFAALSVPHPRAFLANVPKHPTQLLRSWYVGFFQLPLLPEAALRARDFAAIDRMFRAMSVPPGRLPAYLAEVKATLARSLPGPLEPYRALRRKPPRDELRVRVPTLFLIGRQEPAIDRHMGDGQERFVDAPFESHVVEGAGHFLHHDRPDHVARLVLDFARRRGGGYSPR